MARWNFLCPLDDTIIGSALLDVPTVKLGLPLVEGDRVGGHVHETPQIDTLSCALGHRWKIQGTVVLERLE